MLNSRNVMRTRIMRPEMSIYIGVVIPYDRVAIRRHQNLGKYLHDAPAPAWGTPPAPAQMQHHPVTKPQLLHKPKKPQPLH
jgi:hypothetical protein